VPESRPAAIGRKSSQTENAQKQTLRLGRQQRTIGCMDDLDVDADWHVLRALAMMCEHYIGSGDGVDHECMTAGEEAVTQLIKHGVLEEDARGGRWTEAGKRLLASW
jgi:hypothetical protein